jgi:hypothetical protein
MVPVIIIHKGNPSYLPTVIQQAKKFNSNVFLIGDNSNKKLVDSKDFCPIDSCSSRATEFSKIYSHLSTNGYDIELFCFQRWLILEEFMRAQEIRRCLYIDSDVLLYANAENEIIKYEQFDFTLTHRCCGSSSFFTHTGLVGICDFMMATYSNKQSYEYEKIASHYHIRQKHKLPGGVCDMTLLEFYSYQICGRVGEMMHIIDGATWDHSINESDQGFDMKSGIKNIQFLNCSGPLGTGFLPHCQKGEERIRFHSLHLQGPAKGKFSEFTHYA